MLRAFSREELSLQTRIRIGLLTCFFLSGITGLVYQIAWVRLTLLTFGVSIYALGAVIGAYMLGLALGSRVMGAIIERHARPLRTYALLEFGIALLAGLSPLLLGLLHSLYPALTNTLPAGSGWLTLVRLLFSLLALTPATFLIGATLPVMCRVYAQQEGRIGLDVGVLYLINTAGAALGCLLTGLVLLRYLGSQNTFLIGVTLNVLVGVGALIIEKVAAGTSPVFRDPARSHRSDATGAPMGAGDGVVPLSGVISARSLQLVAIAYGVSGFVALGYEIIWTRILSIHSAHAIYSFSIVLAVFLAGLALGGAGGSLLLRRRGGSLAQFGGLQLSIGLFSVLLLYVFAKLPELDLASRLEGYSVPYEITLALLTVFPPTLLLGALFPVVCSIYTREQPDAVGDRVGRAAAINTVGAILGSLGASFVLIPLMGLRNAALLLAASNFIIGTVFIQMDTLRGRRLRWAPPVAGLLGAVVLFLLPTGRYLGAYHTESDRLIYYKEGVETTVAVLEYPEDDYKISFVNGRDEVPTDQASMDAFRLLGHLPPLLYPTAERALILSFGNGIATGTMNGHLIPQIDAVDLSAEMIEAAAAYASENRDVLESDALTLHIEDGRNFLLRAEEPYDIISVDATHPANASSWALFTREFYTLVDEKLSADGVFMQWLPIHSVPEDDYRKILRTVWDVFPNVTLWTTGATHSYIVATRQPLNDPALDLLLQRVASNADVLRDLGDPSRFSRYLVMDHEQFGRYVRVGPIVTDDDAFFIPSR